MYHNNYFTDEQWECIRVCVANAPIPYDITKKKIARPGRTIRYGLKNIKDRPSETNSPQDGVGG